jgi:hypothetical protein
MIGVTNVGSSTDVEANRDGRAIASSVAKDGAGRGGDGTPSADGVAPSLLSASVPASTRNPRVNRVLPPPSTAADMV